MREKPRTVYERSTFRVYNNSRLVEFVFYRVQCGLVFVRTRTPEKRHKSVPRNGLTKRECVRDGFQNIRDFGQRF